MFALKVSGEPRPGLWCALASFGQCLARVKILGSSAPPPLYEPKYSFLNKSIWVGPNSHVLLSG